MTEQNDTPDEAVAATVAATITDLEQRCAGIRRQAENTIRKRCETGDLDVPPQPKPITRESTGEEREAYKAKLAARTAAIEAHVKQHAPGVVLARRQAFAASNNPRRRGVAMALAGEPLKRAAHVFLGLEQPTRATTPEPPAEPPAEQLSAPSFEAGVDE